MNEIRMLLKRLAMADRTENAIIIEEEIEKKFDEQQAELGKMWNEVEHVKELQAKLIEIRREGKNVYHRTLIGTGSLIEIPKKIEFCPYCEGQLTASITGCEQQEDGSWAAMELQVDCEAEPAMDSEEWENFIQAHSEMPYVYMLPVEERIKAWINRHFFFEVDEEKP